MKEPLKRLIDTYGYNEPILTTELKEDLVLTIPEFNILIRGSINEGTLLRLQRGIYLVPNEETDLNNLGAVADRIIEKRFMHHRGKAFGYITGITLANNLGLTERTEEIPTILTHTSGAMKWQFSLYGRTVNIMRTFTEVNNRTYRLLQVLDVLNDFEALSDIPLDEAKGILLNHLDGLDILKAEVLICLRYYKGQARENAEKIGLL